MLYSVAWCSQKRLWRRQDIRARTVIPLSTVWGPWRAVIWLGSSWNRTAYVWVDKIRFENWRTSLLCCFLRVQSTSGWYPRLRTKNIWTCPWEALHSLVLCSLCNPGFVTALTVLYFSPTRDICAFLQKRLLKPFLFELGRGYSSPAWCWSPKVTRSRQFGPPRDGIEYIGRIFSDYDCTRCVTGHGNSRWPLHIFANG